MTARANGEVIDGSMYWLTSRTLRSTSRSTWPVSWARRQRGFEAFHVGLGVGKALPKLARLVFLSLAARLQARPELSDVARVAFGPLYQAPDERSHEPDPSHEAYQKQREQQFEHRHLAHCSPVGGYRQDR